MVMGVSGAGKTLVGRALADALAWPFFDADDFHTTSNIQKMASGTALEAPDRVEWLAAMRRVLLPIDAADGNAVLACSALRRAFRESLRAGMHDMRFVHLKVDRQVVRSRVSAREGHFMPASLVDSQFATLEEPEDAIIVDASMPPERIVTEVLRRMSRQADLSR